jgi:uncharacterized membrane protein YhhN
MIRRRVAIACVVAYSSAGLVHIVAQLVGHDLGISFADVTMMPLLAVGMLLTAPRERLTALVVIGLGFSWLGDITGGFLLAKIVLFFGAQLAYGAAFWPHRRRSVLSRPFLLIGYGVVIVALTVLMASRAGSLAVPVAVYGAAVAIMAVLATGVSRTVGLGGFLFLLSDIVLASYFFLGPDLIPGSLAINSMLYYPAQLLIAWGMVCSLRSATGNPTPRVPAATG